MPSPAPETSGLKPENVWELDLPPLADVQGKASLDRARLPEHLAPIPDRIFEGVQAGKRLFILLRHGQPKYPGTSGYGYDSQFLWQTHADLFQLVHRGLRPDERLQGFPVFCPDDRGGNISKQVETQYKALAQAARHIEEQSADPAQAFLNWLKAEHQLKEDPRGALVVLTPEVAAAIGKQEALYLFSKLKRLFVEKDQADIIEVPPAPENLYAAWEKHVEGARVDEIRRLLQVAMAHPLPPVDGVPERVTRFPASLETQEGQEPAVRTILREMQRMLIAPSHLLIHGEAGVGKTTLLAGMYQLARQLGLGTHYTSWDRAQQEGLGKALIDHEFLVDPDKASKDPDRLLCVDQADAGSEKGDTSLSRYMNEVNLGHMKSAEGAQFVLKARTRKLALRTRLMMTSNFTAVQLRQNVERTLSGYKTGRDNYDSSTHPLPTLAYLLGDHLRTPSAPEKQPKAQVPDTYSGFIGRLHTVELGGKDWGTLKSGGVDWGI